MSEVPLKHAPLLARFPPDHLPLADRKGYLAHKKSPHPRTLHQAYA